MEEIIIISINIGSIDFKTYLFVPKIISDKLTQSCDLKWRTNKRIFGCLRAHVSAVRNKGGFFKNKLKKINWVFPVFKYPNIINLTINSLMKAKNFHPLRPSVKFCQRTYKSNPSHIEMLGRIIIWGVVYLDDSELVDGITRMSVQISKMKGIFYFIMRLPRYLPLFKQLWRVKGTNWVLKGAGHTFWLL